MDKIRQEFEKWILRKFHNPNYLHKDKDGFYTFLLTAGAWSSWQEQQKKIDELKARLDKAPDLIECILARSLENPDIQELCGQLMDLIEGDQ
ncbi:hypothetical protein [Acinetobacter ursingii]|uniref:hypothetical protein n=1 Tax=Acinetobacter ursingii TaxID=108980 RepID=UPI00124F1280|nr:hypothetical protein [Acinetobacter ursingii]